MTYEIKSGPIPVQASKAGRVTEAVARLKPGEWFVIPSTEFRSKAMRKSRQTNIVMAGRTRGFVVKTRTDTDGSLIVFRPEQP